MREREQGRGNGRVGGAEGERRGTKTGLSSCHVSLPPSKGLGGPPRLNEPGTSHDSVSVAPARQILAGSAVSMGKGAHVSSTTHPFSATVSSLRPHETPTSLVLVLVPALRVLPGAQS